MKRICVFLAVITCLFTLSGCVADYASVDDEKFAKTFKIKTPTPLKSTYIDLSITTAPG